MRTLKFLTTGLMALTFTLSAWAGGDGSDGHTHAAAAPVVAAPLRTALPRVTAETEQFELVGVLDGAVLRLYLDQFGTNAPVPKAQIEVESGAWKAVASEVAPALYEVPAALLAQPGKHPLTITVQSGEVFDLMSATLEVSPAREPQAANQNLPFWGRWAAWSAAGALALATLAWVVIRRRKTNRAH